MVTHDPDLARRASRQLHIADGVIVNDVNGKVVIMTRWIKVYRDLWNNRSRTILVILSIAAGVFAIGMIGSTQQALTTSLASQYAELRPADAILQTEPVLDDDFVTSIRHMRGVDEAEGRRSLPLRISLDGKGETWRDLTLYALDDYDDQRLFIVRQQRWHLAARKRPGVAGTRLDGLPRRQTRRRNPGQDPRWPKIPPDCNRTSPMTCTASRLSSKAGSTATSAWIPSAGWVNPKDTTNFTLMPAAQSNEEIRLISDEVADRIEGEGLPVYQKTLPNRGEHPLNYHHRHRVDFAWVCWLRSPCS